MAFPAKFQESPSPCGQCRPLVLLCLNKAGLTLNDPRIPLVVVESATCLIDDFGPIPMHRPASAAEMGEQIRKAADGGLAVYPLGGGTMLSWGLPPTRDGIALCTTALAGVVDYPARDMTITVQAGLTISRLQELLAGEKQRLPVDVPAAAQATVGGALACNVSGPRRLGFGTLRDYVLGLSVVNNEGKEIKAGGRVVKNVAGYDLGKLFIGSLGTLGIISQVTLRLRPRPEESALVTLGLEPAGLLSLCEILHSSRTRPISMELLNAPAARVLNGQMGPVLPRTPWVMVVGFEDNREAVNWQVQQLIKEIPAEQGPEVNVLAGAAAGPLAQALVDYAAWSEARLTFQASLLPSATAAFCLRAAELPDRLHLQAHAGNGIVLGHALDDLTVERAGALLGDLLGAAVAAQGNLVVRRCPSAWKKTLPLWGPPRNDAWLMLRLKETLDPADLFNPGRLGMVRRGEG